MRSTPCPTPGRRQAVTNHTNTPRCLALGEVHWVGDPIAVIVAETPEQAADAIDLVEVDFDVLPAVVDAEATTHDGAPQLHENAANNIAFNWACGNEARARRRHLMVPKCASTNACVTNA